MDAYFEPKNIKYLSSRQPDIDSAQDVIEYLKMECHEMMLYASKGVVSWSESLSKIRCAKIS